MAGGYFHISERNTHYLMSGTYIVDNPSWLIDDEGGFKKRIEKPLFIDFKEFKAVDANGANEKTVNGYCGFLGFDPINPDRVSYQGIGETIYIDFNIFDVTNNAPGYTGNHLVISILYIAD